MMFRPSRRLPSGLGLDDPSDLQEQIDCIEDSLRLLLQCDVILKDEFSLEVARFQAEDGLARRKPTAAEIGMEEWERKPAYKRALCFMDGVEVMPIAELQRLVLPGKKWDKERQRLWQEFYRERIVRDIDGWGILEGDCVEGAMAPAILYAFSEFTYLARQELTLRNRRKGASKARRKKKR